MLHPVYAYYGELLPGPVRMCQITTLNEMLKELAKALAQIGGVYAIEHFSKGSIL